MTRRETDQDGENYVHLRHTTDEQLYTRIGALEQDTASMSADIKHMAQIVNTLGVKIDSLITGNKTQWGVLATWASVVVAVMIYHSSLATQPIQQRIDVISKELSDVEDKAENYRERLDDVLQREMRDLDTALQREIHLNKAHLEEKINSIEKEINQIRSLL